MRKIDKIKNMRNANLLAEQRYLNSKGLLNEAILPINVDGEEKFAFAEGEENVPSNLYDKLKEAGINPDEVGEIVLTNPEGKKIKTIQADGNLEEGKVKNFVAACIIGATGLIQSCSKEEVNFSFNSNVQGTEYRIDNQNGTEDIDVVDFNGNIKKYKVTFVKKQSGTASHGVALKEKPTDIEIAIYSFGQTLGEESRSNRFSNNGEEVVDYSIAKPKYRVNYLSGAVKNIRELGQYKKAIDFIKDGGADIFNDEMEKAYEKGIINDKITAEEALTNYNY